MDNQLTINLNAMETFEIGVCEELGGYMTIQADSEGEAEEKAREIAEEYGLSFGGGQPCPLNITHRDIYLI